MDVNNISLILASLASFSPLLLGLYLILARIRLSFIDKKFLNNVSIFLNLFSFLLFFILYIIILKNGIQIQFSKEFFNLADYSLNLGIYIDADNAKFLLFSALAYFSIACFSKIFFKLKKQFMFTKRRYFTFLSFITFSTYIFLLSPNLFQAFLVLSFSNILIFLFSYFDIFKTSANYNISRAQRIYLISDFAFLAGILILFKYAILSQGYINSTSIDYSELNILSSYMYGISSNIEFKIMVCAISIAVLARLFIFPLNCYFSFLLNTSSLFYITIAPFLNNIFASYIIVKFSFLADLCASSLYFEIYLLISIFIALLLILFEKNVKIIFAQIISAVNALFFAAYLYYGYDYIIYIYFLLNFIIFFLLFVLFVKDKISFKKRVINKQKGFILEKIHIIIFETLPDKISDILSFVNEKIIDNIYVFLIKIIDFFITLFVVKSTKIKIVNNLKGIFLIFAFVALISIFIALFGRFKC